MPCSLRAPTAGLSPCIGTSYSPRPSFYFFFVKRVVSSHSPNEVNHKRRARVDPSGTQSTSTTKIVGEGRQRDRCVQAQENQRKAVHREATKTNRRLDKICDRGYISGCFCATLQTINGTCERLLPPFPIRTSSRINVTNEPEETYGVFRRKKKKTHKKVFVSNAVGLHTS